MLPPVQCFTATAKQDVKDEIVDYFRANLAQELAIFEGGVERNNLLFEVQTVTQNDKYARINQLLTERLAPIMANEWQCHYLLRKAKEY